MIHQAREDLDENLSTLTILLRYRSCGVTNPLDRVYGMYGLDPVQFRRLGLRVNYDHDAQTLYHDFAVAVLRTERSLDVLSVPKGMQLKVTSPESQLPSWVPNWNQESTTQAILAMEMSNKREHSASYPDDTWDPLFSDDRRKLGIEGYAVDTVQHTVLMDSSDPPEKGPKQSWFRFHCAYASWMRRQEGLTRRVEEVLHTTSDRMYFKEKVSMKIISREILCAGIRDEGIDEAFERQRQSYRIAGRLFFLSGILPIHFFILCVQTAWNFVKIRLGTERGHSVLKPEPDFSAYDRSRGHVLFNTRDGYVGMGPSTAMAGDRIVLCKGSKMPLVLRPMMDDWELLGDSFVVGMMKGERWEGHRCSKMWIQ
jgi:hypothetical protein